MGSWPLYVVHMFQPCRSSKVFQGLSSCSSAVPCWRMAASDASADGCLPLVPVLALVMMGVAVPASDASAGGCLPLVPVPEAACLWCQCWLW